MLTQLYFEIRKGRRMGEERELAEHTLTHTQIPIEDI